MKTNITQRSLIVKTTQIPDSSPAGKDLTIQAGNVHPSRKPHGDARRDLQIHRFLEEYQRIRPVSGDDYNFNKRGDACTWLTIARYCNHSTWDMLLEHFGLEIYSREPADFVYLSERTCVIIDD